MKKHNKALTKSEIRYLQTNLDRNEFPFAVFYITMKVHKSPLKSRPIVSCSGSLLEAIGVWIDSQLKKVAQHQPSYFKSSYDLKQELLSLEIPPNTYIFTADARAMYTNIPTNRALNFIGKYLREEFPDMPVDALMSALRLVMKNNIFQFGDCIYLQKTGTAMGTPPAPGWATLYFALCENKVVPKFANNAFYYKRFIDDIIGLWTITDSRTQDTQWNNFKNAINDPVFQLDWDFSDLQKTADFMDLTISINGDQRIETTLYEKPHSLHLYIPPSSCHPPGLLPGVVHGCIHRFFTLCTNVADIRQKINEFYIQLRRRGWQPYQLLPVFRHATERAQEFVA